MKAAVFHKIGDIRVDDVADPRIEQLDDIILKVTSTAICGSDLHIYDGFFPQLRNLTMGHEFMGIVEETGPAVKNVAVGDRVIVPFTIACGQFFFCARGLHPHCENTNPEYYGPQGDLLKGKGGGLFGYTDLYGGYNGGQAEYVRVPKGNFNPKLVPDDFSDEQVLFLTDIFPTGWAAIEWCKLKGGESVVIFGGGPVGLMAQKAAWLHGAEQVIAVDTEEYRLDMARKVTKAETLNANDEYLIDKLRDMTGGRGPDAAVDAVGTEAKRSFLDKLKEIAHLELGTPRAMGWCFEAARRGGSVAVIGVYGSPYDNYPIHRIFDKGLNISFGQSHVHKDFEHTLELLKQDKVVLDDIITHRLPLSEASHAYDIFKKKKDNCIKVVLKP